MNVNEKNEQNGLCHVFDLLTQNRLTVLAGNPGTEKTSFVLNLIESALSQNPLHSALVFSLENSSGALMDLMIRSKSGISADELDLEKLTEAEKTSVEKAKRDLGELSLLIRDGIHTKEDICEASRALKESISGQGGGKRLGIIAIDNLQLIAQSGKFHRRTSQIKEILRSLKSLSDELEVPIILLAQLEKEIFYAPSVDNLTYAETIREYADSVALLGYREMSAPVGDGEEYIHKIRLDLIGMPENATKTIPLIFNRTHMRYMPAC